MGLLDGEPEAKSDNIMRSLESHSNDCSLSDTVGNFNNNVSSALNAVAPVEVIKRLTESAYVCTMYEEIKSIMRIKLLQDNRRKLGSEFAEISTESQCVYNKAISMARKAGNFYLFNLFISTNITKQRQKKKKRLLVQGCIRWSPW